MLVPVFGSSSKSGICVFDYEDCNSYAGKPETDTKIEKLFQLPEVIDEQNVPDAEGARALSTVHLCEQLVIPDILNFNDSPLGKWILWRIFESAQLLGFDKTRNIKKMKYHRTWANRMYRGCDAVAHRHANIGWTIPHLVAIYYTDVPENSADLIFIDDGNYGVMRGNRYFEYPTDKHHPVKSRTGRLVVHDARILHATTSHESDLPRTCLIIEVGFPPLPNPLSR